MDWQGLVAIAGVAVAFVGWITSARKSRVDELVKIIDAQAERIDRLTKRIDQLEAENKNLRDENRTLVAQVIKHARRQVA